MAQRITQPSKEQVRAWMAQRELACRPPPAPHEVRAELGWRLAAPQRPPAWPDCWPWWPYYWWWPGGN